jgi:hypothetical protein
MIIGYSLIVIMSKHKHALAPVADVINLKVIASNVKQPFQYKKISTSTDCFILSATLQEYRNSEQF